MSLPLLSTKFYIPPIRTDGINRPHLVQKLLHGIERPGSFSLLSAPAGSGKTTLLSEFVTQLQQPVAWLSLDEGDNDPVRFWSYLITACQSVQAGIADSALVMLRSSQPLPAEIVPTTLINELAAIDRRLVLVLDDYHVIQQESIHEQLVFLLEHLPGNLHLVISTRFDPPWPLARFRARNRLTEIRAQDLRFTADEVASFLSKMTGLAFSPEEIAALEERTEGWAAGLQLAGLSLKNRGDVAGFIKAFTGSHMYIAEYLVEEVLQHQPEEALQFLLQTSILDRLNGESCAAITGRADAKERLLALYRANLFVLPLDDAGNWFRYHHLFADLLRARLRQSLSEDEVDLLHKRAASWYEQNGFIPEAFSHAIAAKDFGHAAKLIGQNANSMLTRGELVTLMRWIDLLPGEMVFEHPPLIISKVWALTLIGAVQQAGKLLQQVETRAETSSEDPGEVELLGFAAAIRAFFAMMSGEDARALQLAEKAETLLPESSVHVRWLLPYTQGAAYRGQGQYEKAVEAFTRQAQMGEQHNNLVVWGTGVTGIALARHAQGHLRETADVCRQGLRRLAEQGAAQFGSLAKLEVPLVEVLVEQNQLEEAQQRITGVIQRMQGWKMPTDQLHATLAKVQLQAALGDLPGAFETLAAAKRLKGTQPVLMNLARSTDLDEIDLYRKSGDYITAERLMAAYQPGTSNWVELRDQELLALARLRLAQGKPGEAEPVLSSLVNEARIAERKRTQIESSVLKAHLRYVQGDREAALSSLVKGLTLAEAEGYVRVFVDEGDAIRSLLLELARQAAQTSNRAVVPSIGYMNKLLEAFPKPPVIPAETSDLVEQLTPREIEVLQLVAAGDSNRAIAEKLVITVSAVKKHTSNIYGKLNVNSRTQAVAFARQIGLLPKAE